MTPRPGRFLSDALTPENSLPESSDDFLALEFSAKHANDLRFTTQKLADGSRGGTGPAMRTRTSLSPIQTCTADVPSEECRLY